MALIDDFREKHKGLCFAVGEFSNCDPIEMALALIRYGFKVAEIFGTVGERNFGLVKR